MNRTTNNLTTGYGKDTLQMLKQREEIEAAATDSTQLVYIVSSSPGCYPREVALVVGCGNSSPIPRAAT